MKETGRLAYKQDFGQNQRQLFEPINIKHQFERKPLDGHNYVLITAIHTGCRPQPAAELDLKII